jgi:hypothetical protein
MFGTGNVPGDVTPPSQTLSGISSGAGSPVSSSVKDAGPASAAVSSSPEYIKCAARLRYTLARPSPEREEHETLSLHQSVFQKLKYWHLATALHLASQSFRP